MFKKNKLIMICATLILGNTYVQSMEDQEVQKWTQQEAKLDTLMESWHDASIAVLINYAAISYDTYLNPSSQEYSRKCDKISKSLTTSLDSFKNIADELDETSESNLSNLLSSMKHKDKSKYKFYNHIKECLDKKTEVLFLYRDIYKELNINYLNSDKNKLQSAGGCLFQPFERLHGIFKLEVIWEKATRIYLDVLEQIAHTSPSSKEYVRIFDLLDKTEDTADKACMALFKEILTATIENAVSLKIATGNKNDVETKLYTEFSEKFLDKNSKFVDQHEKFDNELQILLDIWEKNIDSQ